MSVPQFSIVQPETTPATAAVRARQLYAEAREAAMEQVTAVEQSLARVIALAAEVAEGGDVYPVGVRDLCRRMTEELNARSATLEALAQRNLDPR